MKYPKGQASPRVLNPRSLVERPKLRPQEILDQVNSMIPIVRVLQMLMAVLVVVVELLVGEAEAVVAAAAILAGEKAW